LSQPFLRVPPFPGARGLPLAVPSASTLAPDNVCEALVTNRVGGTFWAPPATLKAGCDLVLVPDNAAQLEVMLRGSSETGVTVVVPPGMRAPGGLAVLPA